MTIVSSRINENKSNHQDNFELIFHFSSMQIDQWLLPLPLTDIQEKDFQICQEKFQALLDLPLRIHCLPSETLIDPNNGLINNRNPLKMYWQRNLNQLRLFLHSASSSKCQANLIEIHKRRRFQITRYVKSDVSSLSVTISFSANPPSTHHVLQLTITGKHSILEFQIPSRENEFIYRGTYRKLGEDAQLRPVTTLFNCTIDIDQEMMLILNEYGLCRLNC